MPQAVLPVGNGQRQFHGSHVTHWVPTAVSLTKTPVSMVISGFKGLALELDSIMQLSMTLVFGRYSLWKMPSHKRLSLHE